MYKFAHMADIHIGAHSNEFLKELEIKSFNKALDKCVELQVDFILISGDFFHVGIPDLDIVHKIVKKMMELKKLKIPIYVIYGSHDYNPSSKSVIDILEVSNVVKNISDLKEKNDVIELKFIVDTKTGAKITGIPGKSLGLDRNDYAKLDKKNLVNEQGFKIFMFHTGIEEFPSPNIDVEYTTSLSNFPRGFNYYAGGHIHQRKTYVKDGYGPIVYPGTLITGYTKTEIVNTIKDEKRGFYLISFDDKIRDAKFIDLPLFNGKYFEFDFTGKNSVEANQELEKLENEDVATKVVAIKISGNLAGGNVSDINFQKLISVLTDKQALFVDINRYSLTSTKHLTKNFQNSDISLMETEAFENKKNSVKFSRKLLNDNNGVKTARNLLQRFRQITNETKSVADKRIISDGFEILNLTEISKEKDN